MDPDSAGLHVRLYRGRDLAQIARLYYDTVHLVNRRDYTAVQIRAWAPRVYPTWFWAAWFRRCAAVYVAESGTQIVGFAELLILSPKKPPQDSAREAWLQHAVGHIDCFYVHHAWQGKGVGKRMMQTIDAHARRKRLSALVADVSETALPFFMRCGFVVRRRQKKLYRGQRFAQYAMAKRL